VSAMTLTVFLFIYGSLQAKYGADAALWNYFAQRYLLLFSQYAKFGEIIKPQEAPCGLIYVFCSCLEKMSQSV